jgi:hypothetical protein
LEDNKPGRILNKIETKILRDNDFFILEWMNERCVIVYINIR